MPYTEQQLHDVLKMDGPPTIRQLALQTMSDRNDAMADERRDLKYQRPELQRQQHLTQQRKVVALEEKDQDEVPEIKEEKKEAIVESKTGDSPNTIKLQSIEQLSAVKKDNIMMGCLCFVAIIAVVIIVVRECFSKK